MTGTAGDKKGTESYLRTHTLRVNPSSPASQLDQFMNSTLAQRKNQNRCTSTESSSEDESSQISGGGLGLEHPHKSQPTRSAWDPMVASKEENESMERLKRTEAVGG
jgi:hypothetical protein